MKFLKIVIIAAVLLITVNVFAFDIVINNPTDANMVYTLTWLTCDWDQFPARTVMAVGEVLPKTSRNMNVNYKTGKYQIDWFNSDTNTLESSVEVDVSRSMGILNSQPRNPPVFAAGI